MQAVVRLSFDPNAICFLLYNSFMPFYLRGNRLDRRFFLIASFVIITLLITMLPGCSSAQTKSLPNKETNIPDPQNHATQSPIPIRTVVRTLTAKPFSIFTVNPTKNSSVFTQSPTSTPTPEIINLGTQSLIFIAQWTHSIFFVDMATGKGKYFQRPPIQPDQGALLFE
jgi:hypothetical protein